MRVNTFKSKVLEFIAANPGLKRKEYIAAFVEIGMSVNAASLYHYQLVTKVNKLKTINVKTFNGAIRDPKTGRFAKRAA